MVVVAAAVVSVWRSGSGNVVVGRDGFTVAPLNAMCVHCIRSEKEKGYVQVHGYG